MESIEHMELGTLAEEYRENHLEGQTVRNGPYFKHQQWENGRNRSRRVPAEQADGLRQAVAGRQRFEKLAQEFIEITVASTRQTQDSKKNSVSKRPKPNTTKRKTS